MTPAPPDARPQREADHFTQLYTASGHTWWGNLTAAGQRRNDRRLELLRERLAITPATRILEVGCGAGEYTRRLARLGCPVTAIDITPVLVENARRTIPGQQMRFMVMDATAPDLPAGSFDVVFGKSILHHIDYRRALANYRRLLAPGGSIFFSEPNLLNPINFFGLKLPVLRRRLEFSEDEIAFTRGQLEAVLTGLGYSQVRVEHFDFLFPRIPDRLIDAVDRLGRTLEKTPLLRAFSGSLLMTAQA
ncbi:MAG: methyltransferase domain-containing protein [Thermodesulfobacteriota bacterium]